jgi:hypothetical protein
MTPPRFFDHARYSRTGGLASRDGAFANCVDSTNRCNYVMLSVDMGGPLDAPDVLPAGGCESYLWTDWKGRLLPHVGTVERGE